MRTKTVSLVPLLIRCTVLLLFRVSLQFVMGRPIAPKGKACRAYHIVTRKLGLASIDLLQRVVVKRQLVQLPLFQDI